VNKPIRTLSVFCLLLFLALLGNATYLQYIRADELGESRFNARVKEATFARERGAILVGRDPIAESRESDDKYRFQRVYPLPRRYAHVTGWFSYYSERGVEETQNDLLSGEDSSLFVSRLVDLLNNSQPKGGSVELTLDAAAQQAAYDGLRALGDDIQGSVVALEPSSGRILAMVSSPTFDPNRLASHDLDKVNATSERLNARPDKPTLNRAIQTRLPPGSTFKLVTAAAAIESGRYSIDTPVPGGSSYQLPQTTGAGNQIGNGGRSCGTDKIRFVQALEQSCNTTFLQLANELGPERMREQAEKFGFNSTALRDLNGLNGDPQAESQYPDDLNPPQTAMSGIGQSSVNATPLQMAMMVAAIANEGVVMRPHIVRELRSPDFDSLDKTQQEEYSEAMSASTARQLTEMLVSVVDNGTGRSATIPNVDVAGKTGTAESGRDDRTNYAWFVSFAPADDPQVAVAVMIENANVPNDQISGGGLAGPIAKRVMEAVINQ
jgi:peptidoglycan glycosyltransferase